MGKTTRLDSVSIFGGKLSFLIPHEWVEEVEGDNYLFHEPEIDSGWLRVSLITRQNADEAPMEGLRRHFEGKINSGVKRVAKVVEVCDGKPLLADNRTLDVQNVIWCTGYTPGFSWIDLPIFGDDHRPVHDCGVVHRAPGLYFVRLHYLFSMTSDTITGVGRDAERIVKAIEGSTARSRAA